MFSNLSWYEIAVLLLVALFIFGDKLPKAVVDGLRMLRNLRRMAQDATRDLSRELGTDIRVEDLNPRTLIRKHILSEADQAAMVEPFRELTTDLRGRTTGLRDDLTTLGRNADRAIGRRTGPAAGGRTGSGSPRPATPATGSAPPRHAAGADLATRPGSGPAPAAAYDDIT